MPVTVLSNYFLMGLLNDKTKLSPLDFRRAIARACDNLSPPDKNVSDAVDVRSELDLRIGI